MPIHLRPSRSATATAVPHPQNGSSTTSPSLLLAWMMRSSKRLWLLRGVAKAFFCL